MITIFLKCIIVRLSINAWFQVIGYTENLKCLEKQKQYFIECYLESQNYFDWKRPLRSSIGIT